MKIFLYLLFIFYSAVLTALAQSEQSKVALVLSGGGAKGFTHIGVLKVLEEENIPVSIIAGNSIGSIIGGLYAIGYTAKEIETFARTQDWDLLLSDNVPHIHKSPYKQLVESKYLLEFPLDENQESLNLPAGFVTGQNILTTFCGLTANVPDSIDFTNLPLPFACIAFNLITGKEEVLTEGSLPLAMLSSMAIPGAFSPVKYKNSLLVDGGVINNFPVDVAKEMGGDIIIGVDLRQKKDLEEEPLTMNEVLFRIAYLLETEKHNENVALADVVINPELDGYGTFSFSAGAVDSLISVGEAVTREKLPEIKAAIKNKNLNRPDISRKYVEKNKWLITSVNIPESYEEISEFIINRLNLPVNNVYSASDLELAISKVYGHGNFERIYYTLVPEENGYQLNLELNDKREAKFMFGVAANTTDAAAFYINYSQQSYSNLINLVTIDTKLAINPQIDINLETHPSFLPVVGFQLYGSFHNLDVFDDYNKVGEVDIGIASAMLYTFKRYWNVSDIGFGIKEYYYNSSLYGNISPDIEENTGKNKDFFTSAHVFLRFDNLDDIFLPTSGYHFYSKFSLLTNHSTVENLVPVLFLRLQGTFALTSNMTILSGLYHRSIYNTSEFPPVYVNYAANKYTAFTDNYLPLLGQRGVAYLPSIANLAEAGLRIQIAHAHFITPKFSVMANYTDWQEVENTTLQWGGGINYRTTTPIGPIDLTIGIADDFKSFSFIGGVGYDF